MKYPSGVELSIQKACVEHFTARISELSSKFKGRNERCTLERFILFFKTFFKTAPCFILIVWYGNILLLNNHNRMRNVTRNVFVCELSIQCVCMYVFSLITVLGLWLIAAIISMLSMSTKQMHTVVRDKPLVCICLYLEAQPGEMDLFSVSCNEWLLNQTGAELQRHCVRKWHTFAHFC